MADELTALPSSFMSGTSFVLRESPSTYLLADGWTRKLVLTGPSKVEITGTADGADVLYPLTPSQSADLLPGSYQWSRRATKGSGATAESKTIAVGRLVVTPDLHAADDGTQQDALELRLVTLKAIAAAREADTMTAELTRWAVANRMGERPELKEIYRLIALCERAIARRNGAGRSRLVPMTFSNPEAPL